MNYELAKKLKDAGFYQYGRGYIFGDGSKLIEPHSYVPTLSELINAVRASEWDSFYLNTYGGEVWYAEVKKMDSKDGELGRGTNGSNPEEAVARLWLAINL